METDNINALLVNPDFLEVKRSLGASNLFTTLAASHLELWHSAFVKWIIDPSSEIGLGDFPLKRLLNLVLQKLAPSNQNFEELSIGELEALDLSSMSFSLEETIRLHQQAETRRIDISLDDLIERGIVSLTDTLHAECEGKHYVANLIQLEDSSIGIAHSGQQFETPSSAAKAIKHREVNGWEFWKVKDANENSKGTLAELRSKYG